MKSSILIKVFALLLMLCVIQTASAQNLVQKNRVIVLTDIENEPDDAQSLVRFLVYSNQWDTEGIIATTSVHQPNRTAPERIKKIIRAYAQVQPNLLLHEKGFPPADELLEKVSEGPTGFGMAVVGKGNDSSGSRMLIAAVDKADSRPLWVTVWGGPNVLAQALWSVRETRSPQELEQFISKLRVYAISDQDDSGTWIRANFPSLFYIVSPGVYAGGAYHYATWSGISGDFFHGRFSGADFSLVDNVWLKENIQHKGALGAQYPSTEYLMEGDTPSFLNLISNGLSDPEHPEWGGWGGRYELYTPRTEKWFSQPETRAIWTNAVDEVLGVDGRWHTGNHATIWRWRSAYQNDFAARMDWTVKPFDQANHPPQLGISKPITITAKPGDQVQLEIKAEDPDGDALSYQWFYYGEAGSFSVPTGRNGESVEIKNFDQPIARATVPREPIHKLGSMHFIVAVTDHGSPRLTRYGRIIVDVKP